MLRLMKYRLLSVLRDRVTIFWSFFFPLILCTLFYVSFGNIDHTLERIDAAVVVEEQTEAAELFLGYLETIEKEQADLLSVQRMTETEAKKALRDGKVSGVYYAGTERRLLVAKANIEESILQSLLQSYEDHLTLLGEVSREKPENLEKVVKRLGDGTGREGYVREASLGGEESDGMIQYFFALIAMTCMFGCFLGMEGAACLQANVSAVGIRSCVCGISRGKLLLSHFMVIFLVDLLSALLLIGYMIFVLKLYLGREPEKILPIVCAGCLFGVSLGLLVGSIGRWSGSVKIAVMLAVSLGSSFLSGLMVSGIKGVVEEYCPILNRINPSSVIADAFYCISIYPDPERYARDILYLSGGAVFLAAVSLSIVRRAQYDSI